MTFLGCTVAADHLWGAEGLRAIAARLAPETRRVMIDEPLLAVAWHPERLLFDWCEAVWGGPAQRLESAFDLYIDRTVDLSWSRMRRVLVKMLTPGILARRAPELWKQEHTHGSVEVTLGERRAIATLRNHPYVESPLMRRVIGESFRHIMSLTRAPDVRSNHRVEAGALVVDIAWG